METEEIKDEFEKAMEVQTPTDEDSQSEDAKENPSDNTDATENVEQEAQEAPENKEPSLEELQQRIAQIEQENNALKIESKGRLGSTQAERAKRQQAEGKLSEMQETLMKIYEKAVPTEKPQGKQQSVIPVDLDEDGQAFVKPDALENYAEQITAPIKKELEALKNQQAQAIQRTTQEKKIENTINGILAKDGNYPTVYKELQNGMHYLNNIINYMQTNNIINPGQMQTFEKLALFADPEAQKQFSTQFPNLDLERTLRAMDSPYDFEIALKTANKSAKPVAKKQEKMPENLKTLAKKPSSIGNLSNQKNSSGESLDEIFKTLTSEDMIFNLSDAEIAKMERLSRKA